jgi:hypothetical protein
MTTQALSQVDDSAISDLMQVGQAMKTYISNENDAVLALVGERMNRNPGLWRGLFPDAFDKEQTKINLDRLRSAYGAKKAFLDVFVAVQLDIAKRRGNALIAATAMDMRSKLAIFAKNQIDSLTTTLIQSKDSFYARIATHIRGLEQYRDVDDLYENARQSASREIRSYLEWVEGLREGFSDALRAKVEEKE